MSVNLISWRTASRAAGGALPPPLVLAHHPAFAVHRFEHAVGNVADIGFVAGLRGAHQLLRDRPPTRLSQEAARKIIEECLIDVEQGFHTPERPASRRD